MAKHTAGTKYWTNILRQQPSCLCLSMFLYLTKFSVVVFCLSHGLMVTLNLFLKIKVVPKTLKITVLSCLGKLFTSVLNNCLSTFWKIMKFWMKTKQDLEKATQQLIYSHYMLWRKFWNTKEKPFLCLYWL